MSWWKWLGLAGIAGVAGVGVALARKDRTWEEADVDELKAKLHERLGEDSDMASPNEPAGGTRHRGKRLADPRAALTKTLDDELVAAAEELGTAAGTFDPQPESGPEGSAT